MLIKNGTESNNLHVLRVPAAPSRLIGLGSVWKLTFSGFRTKLN